MKAMRLAAAIASTLLASQLVLLLAGCGDFWEAPGGNSTGTTASTTTLTAASPSVTAGGTDLLTATVTPTAATGTVTFYNNNTSIGTGTLSSGTATYTATFSSAGTETLTAKYGGNSTYASSTSSAVTVTVNPAASDSSRPGILTQATISRETNLVLDPAIAWTVTADSQLHNVAGLVLLGSTVQNIDGGGHCVSYSGKAYIAAGESNASGVYELSGGGFLAPEGTAGLDCE
jgi:hypothetical protein